MSAIFIRRWVLFWPSILYPQPYQKSLLLIGLSIWWCCLMSIHVKIWTFIVDDCRGILSTLFPLKGSPELRAVVKFCCAIISVLRKCNDAVSRCRPSSQLWGLSVEATPPSHVQIWTIPTICLCPRLILMQLLLYIRHVYTDFPVIAVLWPLKPLRPCSQFFLAVPKSFFSALMRCCWDFCPPVSWGFSPDTFSLSSRSGVQTLQKRGVAAHSRIRRYWGLSLFTYIPT